MAFSVFSISFAGTLLLLLFPIPGTGQGSYAGTVRDSVNREPIPFATVYFDGTTIGTTTDDDGSFSLSLSAVRLPAMVVVTHLNYQLATRTVKEAGQGGTWLLAPAPNEIAAVEVGDRNNREKNIAEFRERFLGTDEWSQGATLHQTDRLRFNRNYEVDTLHNADILVERYGLPDNLRKVEWAIDGKSLTFEQATNLQAQSNGSLEVDVPALGYRISVNLQRFTVDYRAGSTYGLGSYYFEPYEGTGGRARKKHRRNRQRVYYFSGQHFLRALFEDDLDRQGFATYEMIDGNARPIDLRPFLRSASDGEMTIAGLQDRPITILYFHDRRGRPLPPDRRKRAAYTTSVMLIGGPKATFRADGTLGDSPIGFGGAMGSSQVTRMLPSDYSPSDAD